MRFLSPLEIASLISCFYFVRGRARRVGLAGLASPGRALARVPGQSRVRGARGECQKIGIGNDPKFPYKKRQNYGIFV